MVDHYIIRHKRASNLYIDAEGKLSGSPGRWPDEDTADSWLKRSTQVPSDWDICEVKCFIEPVGSPRPARCGTCGKPH